MRPQRQDERAGVPWEGMRVPRRYPSRDMVLPSVDKVVGRAASFWLTGVRGRTGYAVPHGIPRRCGVVGKVGCYGSGPAAKVTARFSAAVAASTCG